MSNVKVSRENTLADGPTERTLTMLDETEWKTCIKGKIMIDRGKRIKVSNKIKHVENIKIVRVLVR